MRSQSSILQTVARYESLLLAPYAMHSCQTQGRRHPEPEHPYRGPFQRDRDRILHSAAYRRLSGKMQVFTGDMGDYHRTRLTHTQEVSSIARTIARALRLNEDLVEALALFHDIGHPPYGHAGEDTLDECLRAEGGFSHNRYALTIAEHLETRYLRIPGLNLTREVLDSQAQRIDKAAPATPLLEAQAVDLADSISYDAHDTDDAVKLGLVSLEELARIPLIADMVSRVRRRYGRLEPKLLRKAVVHELIDRQVGDLLENSSRLLASQPVGSANEARQAGLRLGASPGVAEQKAELEAFLYQRVYRHPRLNQVRSQAQERIRRLFDGFCRHPDRLPPKFLDWAEQVGTPRSVGDYLAGMTDRYCEQQYRQFFAGDLGSLDESR